MLDFPENPRCNHRNQLCRYKPYRNSIYTDSVNLLPDQNSGKGCRQNHNCILKEGNKAGNRGFFNGFIIAYNEFIPKIWDHAHSKNTKCIHHLSSKFSTTASKQNGNLLGKHHNHYKYDCKHDVTVFQHFIAQDTDSHVVLFSKKDSGHVRNNTNDSPRQHFNNQKDVITNRKYRHTVLTDLINNNRIKPKCLDKTCRHENQHRNACNHCFPEDGKVLGFQTHKPDIPFIGADIKHENHHGK